MFLARVMVAVFFFGTIVSPTNFFVVGLARQAELAECCAHSQIFMCLDKHSASSNSDQMNIWLNIEQRPFE